MIKEITEPVVLLDENGMLRGSSWSRSPLLTYERDSVPAWRRLFKLREWDSYVFGDSAVQVILTVADCSLFGLISATVFCLDRQQTHSECVTLPLTLGSFEMPESVANGDIIYSSNRVSLNFSRSSGKRYIRFRMDEFDDVRPLYINLSLDDSSSAVCCLAEAHDGVAGGFCFDCRVTAMPASGMVLYGGNRFELSPSDACGGLYHGRGVFSTDSERLWGIVCGVTDAGTAGFSLCGSRAFIVRDGRSELIEGVSVTGFDIALEDGKRPVTVSSADGRLWMSFTPSASHSSERRMLGRTIYHRDALCGLCVGEMRFDGGLYKAGSLRGVLCRDRCV